MTEYALEYVEAYKGSKDDPRKINEVRNCKRVILPFELLGSSRMTLTNCGQDIQECSSVSWAPIEFNDGSSNSEGVKVNTSKIKVWKNYIQ